jgi:alpha-L-fucosidase
MKIITLTMVVALLVIIQAEEIYAQSRPAWAKETKEQKEKRMQWWTHDRFGMFIHWGLYALPARHEWVKNRERISDQEYDKYFRNFNPDLYDPKQWAREAKTAGMKYVVLTTKHHEGFCLWDSKYSDYKVTNTPYGKDLLKSFVDAFRAEGIRIGFYYSLIDWHHPDFVYYGGHPPTPVKSEERAAANANRDIYSWWAYFRNFGRKRCDSAPACSEAQFGNSGDRIDFRVNTSILG